jgi:hypothetical protein
MTYLDPTFRGPGLVIRASMMLLALLAALAVTYVLAPSYDFVYWATLLLPIPCVLMLALSLRFWQQGRDRARPAAFVLGCLFIAGGLTFDLWATIRHSPDLAREGNPLARGLLDHGMPLEFVYYYGFGLQAVLALVLCTLWGAFLRHRRVWLETSIQIAPQSFLDFLKATTGGGAISWREYILFPSPPNSRLSAYHTGVFILPPGLIACGLHRWYVGLEWFGLVPYIRPTLSGSLALAAGFALSLIWLYVWYRRNAPAQAVTEVASHTPGSAV